MLTINLHNQDLPFVPEILDLDRVRALRQPRENEIARAVGECCCIVVENGHLRRGQRTARNCITNYTDHMLLLRLHTCTCHAQRQYCESVSRNPPNARGYCCLPHGVSFPLPSVLGGTVRRTCC